MAAEEKRRAALLREDRARKRALPVILLLVLILFGCPPVIGFFMLMHPAQDRPISRVQFENAEYVLTCRIPVDGSVDLFLRECRRGEPEPCPVIKEGYGDASQPECKGMALYIRGGLISAELDEGKVLFTYDPAEAPP